MDGDDFNVSFHTEKNSQENAYFVHLNCFLDWTMNSADNVRL